MSRYRSLHDLRADRYYPHPLRPPSPRWLLDLRRRRWSRPGHFYMTKRQRAAIRRMLRA